MTFCRDRRSGRIEFPTHTVCAIAALLMTSAANAATITNRSDKDVKITITEGPSRQDEFLPSGKMIDGVCRKGCIIRLNDNSKDEYELHGSESVSVEGGFLYYDSSKVEVAPTGGSDTTNGERSN